jgi:hypothetical protein
MILFWCDLAFGYLICNTFTGSSVAGTDLALVVEFLLVLRPLLSHLIPHAPISSRFFSQFDEQLF